jgi:hypothetical protein
MSETMPATAQLSPPPFVIMRIVADYIHAIKALEPCLQLTINPYLLPMLNAMRYSGHIFLCCRRHVGPHEQTPICLMITERELVLAHH